MYYQIKKKSTIPKEWFFFSPEDFSDNTKLSNLSQKAGVIFFSKNLNINNFLKKIEPLLSFCRKRKIKFVIPFSQFWGNKYNPFGMMIEINRKSKKFYSTKNKHRSYFTVAKVHNLKEAFLARGFVDLIFLSPVRKTNSYPDKKPLSKYIFISLCFFFKEELIFALGGVNYTNIKSMKNKNLYGFGAISCFDNNEKI